MGTEKALAQAVLALLHYDKAEAGWLSHPPAQACLSKEEWGAGSLFIWTSQRYLEQFEDVRFEALRGANARKVVLVVGIMAAHALGEGSGVGVSFCGQRGWSQVCFRSADRPAFPPAASAGMRVQGFSVGAQRVPSSEQSTAGPIWGRLTNP